MLLAYFSMIRKVNFPRTITIRLTEEDMQKLDVIAKQQGLAPSPKKSGITRLIRNVIESYLKNL